MGEKFSLRTVREFSLDFDYVKRNFNEVSDEISYLCSKYSDKAATLVAVTKSASDDEVVALCRCGASNIGENRPQMLAARANLIGGAGLSPKMHAIGSVQRNKAKIVVETADLVHSLDSIKLAEAIDKEAEKRGITVPALIELNIAKEAAKGGIMPELAESFLLELQAFSRISVAGIMTIGPVCESEEDIRPYFKEAKRIYDNLNSRYGFAGGGILSMGMSDSYRVAIQEGSTLVRIGRRLFIK